MRYGSIILAALLLGTACGGDEDEEGTPASRATAAGKPAPLAPKPTVPEEQIVDALRAIDSTRVATGVAVRDRSQSAAILEYARVMRIDHRAMSRLLDSLATAVKLTTGQSAAGRELRSRGDTAVARLVALDSGFNNTYLAHEVADHQELLSLIDTLFVQSAKSPQLKSALEQLRPAYAAHLQMAREIQAARLAALRAGSAAPAPAPAPAARPTIDSARIQSDTVRPPPTTTTNN